MTKQSSLVAVITKSLLEPDANNRITLSEAFKLIEQYYMAKQRQEMSTPGTLRTPLGLSLCSPSSALLGDKGDEMEVDKSPDTPRRRSSNSTTLEDTPGSSPTSKSGLIDERYPLLKRLAISSSS